MYVHEDNKAQDIQGSHINHKRNRGSHQSFGKRKTKAI